MKELRKIVLLSVNKFRNAGEKELAYDLLQAYKLATDEKIAAYNLGLFMKYMANKQSRKLYMVEDEIQLLRRYFRKKEVIEYFDAEKKIYRKKYAIYPIGIIIGLALIISGAILVGNKFVETGFNSRQLPFARSGFTYIVWGLLILIICATKFRYSYLQNQFLTKYK